MALSLNNFVEYKLSTKNNLNLLFDVKKQLPTAFEWTCAVEEFKVKMKELIEKDVTPSDVTV